MNCLHFQSELESAILDRSQPSPELVEHGCQCAATECRSLWNDYVLLESQLPQWLESESAPSAVDPRSIVRAAAEQGTLIGNRSLDADPNTRRLPLSWLAVAVAGVAIVGIITALNPARERDALVDAPKPVPAAPLPSVSDVPHAVPMVATTQDPESDREALSELSHTYVGWIHGSAHQISETVAFVLSAPPAMDPVPVLPWYDTLQERLQPLGETFQWTMDGLLEEVSGDSEQAS